MALERSGVEIVAQGAEKSARSVDTFRKSLEKLTKSQAAAGKSSGLNKVTRGLGGLTNKAKAFNARMGAAQSRLKNVLDSVGRLVPSVGRLSTGFGGAGSAAKGLSTALAGVSASALAAVAAVAALAIGLVAVIKLGARGARLQQTAQAFGNMVAAAGDATQVLNGLRQSTRGTVGDFELMTLSTLALAGASEDLKKEFLAVGEDGGVALGRVFEGTRRIAEATGVNAAIVREKFVRGLRVQRAALLDDVGVTVDAAKAQDIYAAAIGKTASQLTETEKKAAFAREAIRQLDDITASLGERSTALEDFQRPIIALRNIFDKLSVALVPIFEPIASLFRVIGDGMEMIASFAFPIISRLAELVGNILSLAFRTVGFVIITLFGPALQLIGPVIVHIIAAITLLLDGLNALFTPMETMRDLFSTTGGAGQGMAATFQRVSAVIRGVISSVSAAAAGLFAPFARMAAQVSQIVNLFFNRMVGRIATSVKQSIFIAGAGGGAITGAFAAGILRGGTQVIQAVTAIAQIVADFLQGFSPPKVGPLSRIDEGGFNVAKSWADGFRKGFTRPGDIIRDEITEKLGAIGDLVADDLDKRFRALDIALLPFNEQLSLAKAQVEEIAGFVDPALKAVERQRKAALRAFGRGEAEAESVRQFDRQLERLRKIKSEGEAIADQAAIEHAFAKSQQATQRALLEIQKNRLDLLGKEEVAAQAVAAVLPAAAFGGGGGAGAGAGLAKPPKKPPKGKKPPVGAGGEAIEEAALGAGGIPSGAAPDLFGNEAVDNAREGILGFFGGLPGIAKDAAQPVAEAGGIFGEGFAAGFADSGFDEALGEFNAGTGELQAQIARIAKSDPVQTITDKFEGLSTILNDPLAAMTESLGNVFGPDGDIALAVSGLFAEEGLFGPAGPIATAFTDLFGPESPIMSAIGEDSPLLLAFTTFADLAGGAITTMQNTILTQLNILTNGIKTKLGIIGTIVRIAFLSPLSPFNLAQIRVAGIFNAILGILTAFADTGVGSALQGLAGQLFTALESPIINTINSIIAAFESAVNGVIDALPSIITDPLGIGGGVTAPRVSGGNNPFAGGAAEFPAGTYTPTGTVGNRTFGPAVPRQGGGLGVRGLAVIGENGPELVNLRRPADIFPATATRAILDLLGGSSSPMGAGSISNMNSTTNNNQRSMTANFNNTTPRDSILLLRELEAL